MDLEGPHVPTPRCSPLMQLTLPPGNRHEDVSMFCMSKAYCDLTSGHFYRFPETQAFLWAHTLIFILTSSMCKVATGLDTADTVRLETSPSWLSICQLVYQKSQFTSWSDVRSVYLLPMEARKGVLDTLELELQLWAAWRGSWELEEQHFLSSP